MKLRIPKPPFAQWAPALLILALAVVLLTAWPRKAEHDSTIIQGATSIEPAPLDVKPAEPPVYTALSRRLVEYHISVSLAPEKKELHGNQTVTWENPGKKPVQELYLHLYPNAFESDNSTFNRESGGKLRNDARTAGSTGSMTLLAIQSEHGDDLSRLTEYVRPDDGNSDDHTLLKVRLLTPVPAGGKVTLRMEYRVQLPEVYARMGYSGDFYMAGQWFPKLAVYEPAGTRGRTEEGWNLHQYHGNSEFYADFGIYDVKIRVPSGYTVAATGFPTKPAVEEKSSKTYRFYADDVHDFAWAASPHFIYQEEKFSVPGVPGVKIKLYLDPLHKDLKARYFQAAKKALTRYSEWYGEYPYSTLSIVVPPAGGNGAGGMEYPTLITAWGASAETPGLSLERVIVHEIGHQWWYGMVASNEFEEAWLDEGFTSYAEDKVMEREYGETSNLPVEASYVTNPESLKLPSWEYGSHDGYSDNVYIRGKLVLNAIERQIGQDKMTRVLRSYFSRYKFQHPSTENFQSTLESTTGKSWSEFFQAYVYGNLMSDFSVDAIRVRKLETSSKDAPSYENLVMIRKQGGPWPSVPIRIHFRDGASRDIIWSTDANEIQYKLVHSSPVDWVQVDPDRSLVLESRLINNYLKADVNAKQKQRFSISVQKIIETLISGVAW
ncbi:M1 family metallopeptidase [Gorillibacterium timonense]|uniref:M1 family metallopeptidase n=1 Tax=Gorillibacterium timonense TaxID=1689269 RepID=UPI00071D606D|nr:M1 family metallopeptidase [Gorillibacterium timonense]